jgi:hypothetical protein
VVIAKADDFAVSSIGICVTPFTCGLMPSLSASSVVLGKRSTAGLGAAVVNWGGQWVALSVLTRCEEAARGTGL